MKKSIFGSILLLMFLFIMGCGKEEVKEEAKATEETVEQVVEDEGLNELRIGLIGDVLNMDPYANNEGVSNTVSLHMYETLFEAGYNLESIPALAESYEVSDDLLSWTFKLREGVKYHDGSTFTADDIIFSFDRAKMAYSAYQSFLATVESYVAIDDNTLLVKTKAVDALLISKLRYIPIVNGTYFAGKSDEFISQNPNGTGRYKLEKYIPEDTITLKANAGYWGGKQAIETVVFKPISNAATRVANIMTGNVDIIDDVPVRDVMALEKNPNVRVIEQPSLRNIHMMMAGWSETPSIDAEVNMITPKGDNPLVKLKVRQAIYHAINKQEIMEKVMNGYAVEATTLAPDNFVGSNKAIKSLDYKPEESMKLLDQAGYKVQKSGELEGYRFQLTLDAPNDRYINDAQVATAIAGYLEKVGIKVNLNLMSRSIFFSYISATNKKGDNTHLLMTGWSDDNTGETTAIAMDSLYSNSQDGEIVAGFGGINRGFYQNPKVDAIIDKALATVDETERGEVIKEAWQIASDEVANIPLYFQKDIFAVRKGIKYTPRANKYIFAWDFEAE